MRVLFASTRGAGHYHPLVPFAAACLRAGHEVLVAAPPALAETVEGAGFQYWGFDAPPEDELGEVWSQVPSLPPDEQNALVIREIFGRLDTTASLPRLLEACRDWRPDVVVREPSEFGSAIAAESHGIPHARVGNVLAALETESTRLAAGAVDALRRSSGLAPDPHADVLRSSPYLTVFPASFEDPADPAQAQTLRFSDPAWAEPPSSAEAPWDAGDGPLVYLTFGSVAGGLEQVAPVYRVALEAVADLPVRVLLTIGREADPGAFADVPANVRVESWVPQAEVLGRADAVVCHAGAGSTLGALASGLPLVVVPLFADQPYNARRVEALGAGVSVIPDGDPSLIAAAIRDGVRHVLEDESYRRAAEALAAEMRSQPPADAAVDVLSGLVGVAR